MGSTKTNLRLLGTLILLPSCLKQADLQLPQETEFLGAVLHQEPEPIGSALIPLASSPNGLPITAREGEEFTLLGFSSQQLQSTGLQPQRFESGTLSPILEPESCDPPLPASAWQARYDGRGEPVTDAVELTLTHDALKNSCPDTIRPIRGAVLNQSAPCAPLIQRSGCVLDLDLSSCGNLPNAKGRILPSGDLCVEPPAGCTREDGSAIRCGSAGVSLSTCPEDLPIQTFSIVEPQELRVPFSSTLAPRPGLVSVFSGWLSDFVVLSDRVISASYADAMGQPMLRNVACRPISADLDYIPGMRLHLFDLTGRSLGDVQAPPCLVQMTPDPHGDGFLAFFRNDPDVAQQSPKFAIGRFDRDGALVEQADLPDDLMREWRNANWYYNVRSTALSSDGDLLYAVLDAPPAGSAGPGFAPLQGRVYAIDTQTLAVRFKSELLGESTNLSTIALDGDRALVLDAGLRTVMVLDAGDLQVRSAALARPMGTPLHMAQLDDPPSFYIFEAGNLPALSILTQSLGERRPIVAEGASTVTYAAPWSAAPDVLFAGALIRAELFDDINLRIARLLRFDLRRERFVPCDQQLGIGPITRMLEGPQGGLWLLLPWEAKLLRLSAQGS